MKIEDSEAEILRTPIKIEKLSWWNRSGVEFIMNFEFHGFLEKKRIFFLKKKLRIFRSQRIFPGASRPRTPARGVIARGVLLVPFG